MNIQDIGALAELLSALAVLASLIYLATQIRQNTAMIIAQTVQASVDATQRVLLHRVQDDKLREVLRKARFEGSLDLDEYELLASYLQAVFMNFQARFQHNARGLFDRSVNESFELILMDYLAQPYVRQWWSFAESLFGAEFKAHCEAIITTLKDGSPPPVNDWADAVLALKKPEDRFPSEKDVLRPKS